MVSHSESTFVIVEVTGPITVGDSDVVVQQRDVDSGSHDGFSGNTGFLSSPTLNSVSRELLGQE